MSALLCTLLSPPVQALGWAVQLEWLVVVLTIQLIWNPWFTWHSCQCWMAGIKHKTHLKYLVLIGSMSALLWCHPVLALGGGAVQLGWPVLNIKPFWNPLFTWDPCQQVWLWDLQPAKYYWNHCDIEMIRDNCSLYQIQTRVLTGKNNKDKLNISFSETPLQKL